jgi:hypothetical protein
MLAFSESAAMTTTKQSETAPNASEATTASINLDEATLALGPEKPCALGERFMAERSLGGCGRITRAVAGTLAPSTGNIAAVPRLASPQALMAVKDYAPAAMLA